MEDCDLSDRNSRYDVNIKVASESSNFRVLQSSPAEKLVRMELEVWRSAAVLRHIQCSVSLG